MPKVEHTPRKLQRQMGGNLTPTNKNDSCGSRSETRTRHRNCEVMEKFNSWMINVVKSIHYSDNKAMTEAYERVVQNEINEIEVNEVIILNE